MPYSDGTLRPWILDQLLQRGAATFRQVVDVGAGAGTARSSYGPSMPDAKWTAIEIWEPYVERFALRTIYDDVIIGDARKLTPLPPADLYIFGDVLEHMEQFEAVSVWKRALTVARWLVINMPVLDYPQGAEFGNPYETHLHQWSMTSVARYFQGIVAASGPRADLLPGTTVGAFVAQGYGERLL